MSENKKLHIAYVCREFGPVTGGGIGTYIYNACMAMVDKGHRVFLVTDCFDEKNIGLLPEGIELVKLCHTKPNRQGSFVSPNHEYSYRVYDTLKDFTRKTILDIAEFAEFGVEGFASIRAKRLFGEFENTKLIVKLHTPSSLLYTINEDKRLSADGLCSYTMEDYCIRYADMVTSPSLSLGEYFADRVGRGDIKKCPYPMELPETGKPRKFSSKQIKRVRLIGSVQIRKGIDIFIKAAVQVLEHDPEFVFEIWGADRGPLLFGKTCTQIVSKLIPEKFKEKIVFSGSVPYEEIPELFMDSCFCVYPSRWENWANVCLEAMSFGCVVLASQEGGMSEMIEHGVSGFVIDPLDPSDISNIILQHSTQPDKLAQISENAQKRSTFICNPDTAASQIQQNYLESYEKKEWKTIDSGKRDIPLVSVIIPYFNQPQYLQETVNSVKASDYPAIEIIVVNDGSTLESANEVFDSLEGVKKLRKENGGLSSARNYGIKRAAGEFILPLDSDDLIEPQYVRSGVEALINNPELGYVSCHAQNFGVVKNAYIPVGYVPELMPFANTHGKCCNLYRKDVFDKCGGYDEVMTSYEDWDFLLTLEEGGVEGDVLPDEMFRYRRHFDSMVYSIANIQRADLIQYMMIKHEDMLQTHAARMAIILARFWKETEVQLEFSRQQIINSQFAPKHFGALQISDPVRVQIYFPTGRGWLEHKSVFCEYPRDKWCDLTINLPFEEGEPGPLRIDPADCSGTVIVREIVLRDRKTGKIVFKAGKKSGFEGCTFSSGVGTEKYGNYLSIKSMDDDPQILIKRQKKGSMVLGISLYCCSEIDCNVREIIDSCHFDSMKYTIKKIARRMIGI